MLETERKDNQRLPNERAESAPFRKGSATKRFGPLGIDMNLNAYQSAGACKYTRASKHRGKLQVDRQPSALAPPCTNSHPLHPHPVLLSLSLPSSSLRTLNLTSNLLILLCDCLIFRPLLESCLWWGGALDSIIPWTTGGGTETGRHIHRPAVGPFDLGVVQYYPDGSQHWAVANSLRRQPICQPRERSQDQEKTRLVNNVPGSGQPTRPRRSGALGFLLFPTATIPPRPRPCLPHPPPPSTAPAPFPPYPPITC